MPLNVEIKARVHDPECLAAIIHDLTDSLGTILKQEDTYFNVNNGRLKLRVLEHESLGELIYYERADESGPRQSEFFSTFVADAAAFKLQMEKALGILTTVKKCRRLYMYGTTRIHLDEVVNLGCFLELEVILQPGQTIEDGEKVAKELMAQLGVQASDLIAVGYMNLLLQKIHNRGDIAPVTAVAESGDLPQGINAK